MVLSGPRLVPVGLATSVTRLFLDFQATLLE